MTGAASPQNLPRSAQPTPEIRTFGTGASRNSDEGKIDYEGHVSPLMIKMLGEYMNKHRYMADGSLRDSDNWQKGVPLDVYMKSMWRHFFAVWENHRGWPSNESMEDALCGLLFNLQGYMHVLEQRKINNDN